MTPDIIRVTDQTLGVSYGSQATYRGWPNHTDRYTQRFSTAYVTGTHSIKAGVNLGLRYECERGATPPAGIPHPGVMSRITVTGH